MGYTHYFTWKITPDPERLQACMEAMLPVLTDQRAILAGPEGLSEPEIEGGILFNGKRLSDDDLGDSHEGFWFPGEYDPKPTCTIQNLDGSIETYNPSGFNFCKTERKPYDGAVVACLLIARDFFTHKELQIRSDGDWPHEWQHGAMNWAGSPQTDHSTPSGAAIYQRVTDKKARSPLSRRR